MNSERITLIDQSKVPASDRFGELILTKFPFRIGRKQTQGEDPFQFELQENDLNLEEEKRPFQASRNHLEIGFSAGSAYVRDLGSANGTLVNGLRMGGGRSGSATFILDKKENTIQLGKKNSKWIFQLKVPQQSQKYRMLVADDESEIRMIINSLFNEEYEIIEAANGEDALEICLKENPDIAILDWEMPKLDGVKACKHLKTNLKTANLPIVMLTGRKQTNDRIMGIEAGADDYIMKPPDYEDLQTRVNAALSRSLHFRAVHWLTGIASEDTFRKEVNDFLGNKTTKKEFELIAVTLQNLGVMQENNGLSATDLLVQNCAEELWRISLKTERTIVGQLRLGQWGILTPSRNRRFVEKAIKTGITKLTETTPAKCRIKIYSTGKCTNYYDFVGMV